MRDPNPYDPPPENATKRNKEKRSQTSTALAVVLIWFPSALIALGLLAGMVRAYLASVR